MNLATQSQDARTAAIAQCRNLESRCIAIGSETGADMARGWADNLTAESWMPASFYRWWLADLTRFVERREAQTERAAA
ncbi:MAG: hypothetical protein AB7E60_02910 [Sphingobium sp.]